MQINTKYEIDEVVYFMNEKVPTKNKITGITILIGKQASSIGKALVRKSTAANVCYSVDGSDMAFYENSIFRTKEELQEHEIIKLKHSFESADAVTTVTDTAPF